MLCPHFSGGEICELPLAELRCHEEIELHRFRQVLYQVQQTGELQQPILVDQKTKTILDGHHRYHVARDLGWEKIPCCLVDYQSEWVEVRSRRPEITVSKAEVLRRALQSELFPPKTTKHIVRRPPCTRCGVTAEGEAHLAFSPEKL